MPLTCGCAAGVVFPAAIKTVDVTVTVEGLLLANETVTPFAGAAALKVTWSAADWFSPTVTPAGNKIPPVAACVTITVAFALATSGAVAVIVTDPADTPFTGTDALVASVAKLTVAGTVATAILLVLKLTVNA